MKKNRRNNVGNKGFSLLELMLVIAIIGVLTAIAAWNLTGTGNRAKVKASYASMKVVRNAVRTYQLDHNAYPVSLDIMTQGANPYLSSDNKLVDGWNQSFIYAVPGSNGRDFDLFSKGQDTLFGTADDLSVWDDPEKTG
jgi:general secretion pathway protein G